ncbi:MAG: hypothetical protein K2J79_07045 [Ruminiclostridium sp.]|nr:hypothetical protein [Ruminiclostridium sp.]
MKLIIKKILSLILLCTVLAGCSNSTSSHEIHLEQSNCPISTMRTGTERQGIKSAGNSFECTKEGSYFMYEGLKGGSWLLYVDHGSDTVIKLCGRPDCSHTDSSCNAHFNIAHTLCYYDGYLYTLDRNDNNMSITDMDLIRMNLDGTEREVVYNTYEYAQANGYKNIVNETIFNGILFLHPADSMSREICFLTALTIC